MSYKYKLENHSSRHKHKCPECGEKTFVYYVYNANNLPIDGNFCGRCDRENSCGYELKPLEYFERFGIEPQYFENINENDEYGEDDEYYNTAIKRIDTSYFDDYNTNYANTFTAFLLTYLKHRYGNEDKAYAALSKLIHMYRLNTYTDEDSEDNETIYCKYGEGVIFWQFDELNELRSGKIMFYNVLGQRMHYMNWIHRLHSINNFKLEQCLYGLHLLNEYSQAKQILVLESEKTAIILKDVFLDNNDVQVMACGSVNNLQADKFRAFSGMDKDIYLIPDVGCEKKWQERADKIMSEIDVSIVVIDAVEFTNTFLPPLNFTYEEGEDVADYLIVKYMGENYRK